MDDISGVGESLRRAKDESFTLYNSCKQQYTRLLTEIEEANRKAYNMVEAAESMKRVADANYELAMHRLENAEDDSERESAREQLRSAQASQAEASHEISVASVAYARAQANMKKLTDVWEHYTASQDCMFLIPKRFPTPMRWLPHSVENWKSQMSYEDICY